MCKESMGLYSKSHEERNSPSELPILSLDFGDMMKGGGQSSPQPASSTSSSVSNTPPTTPLTPGTPLSGPGAPLTPSGSASLASLPPLGPPTTPSYPGPYRHRLPSFTESDSQSSTRDALSDDAASQSDSQSDVASVGSSTAEWVNFDITPLVKKELKDAIITRRKTMGLPDVKVDFTPRSPDKLTPEEEERRRLQKERNRDAASKCRSKKRNAVGRLVEEAQQLETENTKLREEMKALESERSQLQFLLDMHSPKCMLQQPSSSPLESNTSSSIQFTDSTCESVPPFIHSTGSEVITHNLPMSTESVTAGANTGKPSHTAGSTSPYGSSCFPPTPSTTHSLSCTEPSTPATPTSFMDAPVFPTMSSSTIPVSIEPDPIFQDTSTSVLPIATLANSSACNLSDGFSIPDIVDFPPGAPPTPELFDDHEDPLSESFVKRYLGMDPFVSADLSLPTIADNTAVPGNAQMFNFRESGEIRPSSERPMSTEGYTELAQPRLDSQLRLQTSAQSERINSLPAADDPTQDTPITLSLSALLGISFEGIDETVGDASSFSASSHSAIGL